MQLIGEIPHNWTPEPGNVADASLVLARRTYALVKLGCIYIGRWAGLLQQAMSWKYTHPCSVEVIKDVLGLSDNDIHKGGDDITIGSTCCICLDI